MKRLVGGMLLAISIVLLVANVCFANIAGPSWPPHSVTMTKITK